jgi:hypothetical protein
VLSQARNHPESRAIENLERMVDKDWFRDQGVADQQRSAKLVAHLSTHDVAATGTSSRTPWTGCCRRTSNYTLRWEPIGASPGNVTLRATPAATTLRLNEDLVAADNNPVGGGHSRPPSSRTPPRTRSATW